MMSIARKPGVMALVATFTIVALVALFSGLLRAVNQGPPSSYTNTTSHVVRVIVSKCDGHPATVAVIALPPSNRREAPRPGSACTQSEQYLQPGQTSVDDTSIINAGDF